MPFICEHLPVKDWPSPINSWFPWEGLANVVAKALQDDGAITVVKLCPECALEVGRAMAVHPARQGLTPTIVHQ
jgi:hypothetical protein